MKHINVVFATDNNYAQHLGVAIASLLFNNKKQPFQLFVIHNKISEINKNRLLATVRPLGATINFISGGNCSKVLSDFGISHPAYLRIFIPQLLPSAIKKVIYLDCDVIVKGSIAALWNIDVSKYYLGAVLDTTMVDHLKCLIGKEGFPYFNSGVMLINLKKWRDKNIETALVDFIRRNHEKLLHNDQDALNAVLYDKWLKIDAKFNVQTPVYSSNLLNSNYFNDAAKKPSIIHYTGRGKPWNYVNLQPFKDEYYKYLKMTAWQGYRPGITSQNVLDMLGLSFKKIFPSTFSRVRKYLIKRALSGSIICRSICKYFYIELH